MYDKFFEIYRTRSKDHLVFTLPKDKVIAFDWDDTLIDSHLQFEHAVRRSIELYGSMVNFKRFEHEVTAVIPDWVFEFFDKLEHKIYIISNKPQGLLESEIKDVRLLSKIHKIIGDANKPSIASFRNISADGVMFGDSVRNDLIGSLVAGWEFQLLNVNMMRRNSSVEVIYI